MYFLNFLKMQNAVLYHKSDKSNETKSIEHAEDK
jgi:hypothetical protein